MRGGAGRIGSLALALAAALPLAVIFAAWRQPASAAWVHLADTLLGTVLWNTALLIVGVGLGTAALGVALAWLVSVCEFPGRRVFRVALALPLAVPTYVMAFVFLGLMDFQGPVQRFLLAALALPAHASVDVRGPPGMLAVFILILYPYVYLLACTAVAAQGRTTFEAARTLGMAPVRAFLRVALPIARPAVAAGVSLAVMEALADFGAVAVFNFDTFTTAIYRAWFGMFDLAAASQLASLMLPFVLALLLIERAARARARYDSAGRALSGARIRLRGAQAGCAFGFCAAVVLLAFVAPVAQLLLWAVQEGGGADAAYWTLLRNTFVLGAMAAAATLAGGWLLAATLHRRPDRLVRACVRVATLGYAIPGSVLAVAVLVSLGWIDRQLQELWGWAGSALEWTLVGSVLSLLLAYFVRFLTLSFKTVDRAYDQFRPSLREAAESLGLSRIARARAVYLPLLRPGLATAALLVLIDVMKEMPATLLLRPSGWDTLAVRIYGLTAEGLWERAALPALTLVALGLAPALLLAARTAREVAHGRA